VIWALLLFLLMSFVLVLVRCLGSTVSLEPFLSFSGTYMKVVYV